MGEPEKESDPSRLVKVVPCMLHCGVHGVRISNICVYAHKSRQISLKNQTDIALAHSKSQISSEASRPRAVARAEGQPDGPSGQPQKRHPLLIRLDYDAVHREQRHPELHLRVF